MPNPNIAIIGKGKVGQSLAQLFGLADYSVMLIGRASDQQQQACANADIVFLTVADSEIEAVCTQLSPYFKNGSVVSHCSGALDSSILASAQQCSRASTHPLNTFATLSASLETFKDFEHGSYLYSEGDTAALETLLPLFEKIGFTTNVIQKDAKPLYHAACVFACNYLSSLMDMSLEAAEAAKLDRNVFWQSVQPLIQATLENISNNDTQQSLSGPIERGDDQTVATHLDALRRVSPELSTSYSDLGLRALKLAVEKGELSAKKVDAIQKLLG